MYKLNIIVEEDENGFYAYCPELKGCKSQGDTLKEVQTNITEAVELYLETLSEDEKQKLLQKKITTMTKDFKRLNHKFLQRSQLIKNGSKKGNC